jgi:regulator of protease activity HflC (stomatin/prohibitin superfamily)
MVEKEKTVEEQVLMITLKWAIPVILVIILLTGFYIIPAGNRGVLLTFGKPEVQAVGEGLHYKIPLVQKIVRMSIQTQKYEADASASSSDLQVVTSKIATNYHLESASVPTLYRDVGLDYATKVIMPMEQEVVKSTTARFTAEELITKREDVRQEMKSTLIERLAPRGIIVEEVSIINFDFSPEFNTAIENKVVALQNKLKAQNDLERLKIEAEQIVVTATAQAEAQRLQKLQLTPELVQMKALAVQEEAIAKWNGILPLVTGGATPFVNLGTLGSSSAFVNSTAQ